MVDNNPAAPKFLDENEPCFRELRGTCDNDHRDHCAKGIGSEVRHAPVTTPEEEEALWMSLVLNVVYKQATLCI